MGSQENHSRGGIVEDERAAARSDQNEETVPLVSAEQDLKRTKRHQGVQVSKGKMYTLLGTILVLFGLLVANTFTDWQAFRGVLQVERENVDVTGLVPEEVVRPLQLVNAEQAQADFEVDEQIAIEEVLSQSHSANVVLGKEEKQKKKKKKEETKTEAAPEVAVGGGADNEVDGIRAQIQAVKKRMAENKGASGEARRQNEVDRREVEALERRLRKATGSTDKYDPEREKQRREKYKRLEKRREEAKVARKISLDPEVERIVNSFDGDLRPPEYCFTSPKGNPARPKQDAASGGGGGAKGRGLLRRRRKRNKNRPSTGGGRVPPDWAVLPLNASQAILRVAAEKYPCLILHKDCFDTSYYSGAKKLRQWYEKAYFAKSKLTWEERLEKLEDFSKLRLGTCAVVGNADNTIKGKFGKEIDEHDFVIRYNVITKPFEEAIGKKTDGLFDKMNYLGTEFAPDTTPTTFNLFPKYIPNELNPAKLPGRKKALLYGPPFLSQWRRDANRMIDLYKEAKNIHVVIRAYGQNKMQHASGGVSRVRAIVELLRLGVCDRLDLYGFSSGGGKYFIQRMKVSSAHPIRAENFVYRLWMATGVHGKFCMYGD